MQRTKETAGLDRSLYWTEQRHPIRAHIMPAQEMFPPLFRREALLGPLQNLANMNTLEGCIDLAYDLIP